MSAAQQGLALEPVYDRALSSPSYLRLGPSVPSSELIHIRRHLHLNCNKWDTQVGDTSVISPQALIISSTEWAWLCQSAEQLAEETIRAEARLLESGDKADVLGMPPALSRILFCAKPPPIPSVNVTRSMRFDFHPTAAGWRVSEINSDVPGGWTEATELPKLYQPFYEGMQRPPSPLDAWAGSLRRLSNGGRVALLCAPGFLEDQQVIFAFMRKLAEHKIPCSATQQPSALQWQPGGSCKLRSTGQSIHAVVRFFQLEWLARMPTSQWRQLIQPQNIPVTNPAVSALSESKRFMLSFRNMSEFPKWRALLPECRDPRGVASSEWEEWVLKATYSNAGDAVFLCGNYSQNERQKIIAKALRNPLQWVAQRRFETWAITSERQELLRPCVGVYIVDGKAAGAYVRLSAGEVTNGFAREAPLLIEHTA